MDDKNMAIAIFDFDGTLTSRSTVLAFLHFANPLRFYILIPLLMPLLILYLSNLISVDKLNRWLCTFFFKGVAKERLVAVGKHFAVHKLPSFIRVEAMIKLREHQQNDHPCILATAAYDVYIRPWGECHGFTEVVCTELAHDEHGKLTGKIQGKSCYGPEKLNKIKQVLPTSNPIIYAYGDSHGDKEMLKFATYPFYRRFDSNITLH